MTITATPSEISYSGDGVSVTFPIPFVFDVASDLKVLSRDANGNVTTLTSGFTVSGGSGSTGSITFSTPPAANVDIIILDDLARTQSTDYVSNDPFAAESHERALDRGARISKRLYQLLQRTVHIQDGDTGSMVLPLKNSRASKVLAFDEQGSVSVVDARDIATIAAFVNQLNQTFTGDGSTVAFTLDQAPGVTANCQVFIDGLRMVPTVDYTLNSRTLTFAIAPYADAQILVTSGSTLPQIAPSTSVTIESFGAVGDSVTDDTAALTAAALSGLQVKFRSGRTYRHTPLTVTGVNIDWATDGELPATLYCDTSPDTSQSQFNGSQIGTTTVSVAAYPMDVLLPLASVASIQVGDLVVVQNSTLWQSDPRGTAYEGQLAKVIAIIGSTVMLDAALACGMPVGSTVTIYRPIQLRMKGIRFERLAINGSSRGWLVTAADDPHIEDCGAINSTRIGLHLHRCYRGKVERGVYRGANLAISGQLGYGILVEGCWATEVRGTIGKQCRRGIDISGYTGVPSWYCVVAQNQFYGGGFAEDGSDFWPEGEGGSAFGSHGPAVGTLYDNNIAFNAYRGFTIRGRDETVRNNLIVGASFTPVWAQFGGGLLVEGNRYTDQFEEGTASPGTTTGAVSIERRPQTFLHVAGGYDIDKHLTVRNNTARNVKESLIYLESADNPTNWVVHDNVVVVGADVAGTVGIIRGAFPDMENFRAWNNEVIAPTDYTIRKYPYSGLVNGAMQVGEKKYHISLADDTVLRIRTGTTDGQLGVRLFRHSANTTPRFNGFIRFESTTSVDWGGSSGVTVAATALTGTTGVDGETTISFAGDSFYIENRSGGSCKYVLVLEGAH